METAFPNAAKPSRRLDPGATAHGATPEVVKRRGQLDYGHGEDVVRSMLPASDPDHLSFDWEPSDVFKAMAQRHPAEDKPIEPFAVTFLRHLVRVGVTIAFLYAVFGFVAAMSI